VPNITLKPGTQIHDPLIQLGNWAAQQAGNVRKAFSTVANPVIQNLRTPGTSAEDAYAEAWYKNGRQKTDFKGPAYGNAEVVPGKVGGGNAGAFTGRENPNSRTFAISNNAGGYPSSQSLFRTTPGAPTPIVTGANSQGEVDRTQSDMYKQYALNPQGQFNRYFQSPEMDQYFGAASRGKGAPENLAAMEALAGQTSAPTTSPLASYYRSQSAAGRGNMDEIVGALGYKGTPMEQWAKANPMLAMREFSKKFPAGEPTEGQSDDTIRAAMQAGTFYPSEGSPKPFGTPVNTVPAPPEQQGSSMMAPFTQSADISKLFTTPEGQMPQFPVNSDLPIRDKVQKFIMGNFAAPDNAAFVNQPNRKNVDYSSIFN
jgi:hypothetical protein